MKFLSQRLLFIILSLVFVLAAFYVYSNFIQPEYTLVSELRGRLAAKADTLERYENAFLKLEQMLGGQNVNQLKESVSRILPNMPDDAYLSAQAVGFAKLQGLTLMSLTNELEPIESSNSRVIRSLGILKTEVKVRGTYSGVRSYVNQLENNLLLIDLMGFAVEPQKEGSVGSSEVLEYTLTLHSYYQTD